MPESASRSQRQVFVDLRQDRAATTSAADACRPPVLCHDADGATSGDEEVQTPSSSNLHEQPSSEHEAASADDDGDDGDLGCVDQDTDKHEGGWQNRHQFLLDDPVKRKDFLDTHLSFMGRCVNRLRTTTNMGGIAEIILLMLDTPTATDERIHAAQFYSW